MEKNLEIQTENIKNLIYEIRDKQVMLDSDLANLYKVTTGNLNKAVKRNEGRFPDDFCFELTKAEYDNLMFQNGISSLEKNYGGRRKMPKVYTEQGVAMLASVLKSEVATKASVTIMRTFVEMRKFISSNILMFEKINLLEKESKETRKLLESTSKDTEKLKENIKENTKRIEEIFKIFKPEESKNKYIFYKGQIYDAFKLLVELIKDAKDKIVLVDNYIDIETLNILCKKNINVEVIIFGSNKLKLSKIDINKFNKQYPKLELRLTDDFHDRFLVIDDEIVYHIGASVKDAGRKTFAISKWEDKDIIDTLINKLK